jgi:uncharacterized Zn finger protein
MNPRVPEGIRTSTRPLGALAQRWLDVFDGFDLKLRPRIVRGRTLARGGRVRELEVAPGTALGEVKDAHAHRPTLRVRTFEEHEWAAVVDVLRSRLDLLGALIEGHLEPELLALFDERRVPLLPNPADIDGDCDCGDWAVPCPHVAAVHHVVGEALEGEPFLVFTMRGRTRDQVLSDLRRAWGDTRAPAAASGPVQDEPLRDVDVFASPVAPATTFRFDPHLKTQPGMLELGPLAGDDDLLRALTPLYDAAAAFALEVALGGDAAPDRRVPTRRRPTAAPAASASQPPPPPPAEDPGEVDLGERLVDALADRAEPADADSLASEVGVPVAQVRAELEALEQLGLVFAAGDDRWQLG